MTYIYYVYVKKILFWIFITVDLLLYCIFLHNPLCVSLSVSNTLDSKRPTDGLKDFSLTQREAKYMLNYVKLR